jgi:hypothetical protein
VEARAVVAEPEGGDEMLAVYLGDPRVLMRLESIGVRRLADPRGHDPCDLMHEINLEAGRPLGRPSIAVQALRNLIGAAQQEPAPGQAHAHG